MADQTFAVHCGFFDAINSDRTYSADEMNRPYKRVISNGVFATPSGTPSTDLQVTASSGMNIICKKGEGLFGDKWFENPSGIAITVPSNTGTVPRIDSVLVQVDTRTSGRVGNIVHRTGTPASSPVPPAINQTEGVKEYRLANIRVNAGVSAITQSMITDRRGSSDCPWVTSLIYQVDTSTLYDQWQAAYEEYFEAEKAIWDAWYAQLTEDLDVSMTLDRHVNTVTTTPQTTGTIPIGLAYNHNTDILEVYINGLRAIEGTHYIVVNDDTAIMVENQLDIGQTVTFVVMRSVISGSATNIMVLLQELESQIAGIAGGTPTVVDSTSDMTDTEKIYVLSSDSKWYYYSATQEDWVIGGTYGGVPTDTTLSISGSAADAKAVGDRMTAVEGDVSDLKSEVNALSYSASVSNTVSGTKSLDYPIVSGVRYKATNTGAKGAQVRFVDADNQTLQSVTVSAGTSAVITSTVNADHVNIWFAGASTVIFEDLSKPVNWLENDVTVMNSTLDDLVTKTSFTRSVAGAEYFDTSIAIGDWIKVSNQTSGNIQVWLRESETNVQTVNVAGGTVAFITSAVVADEVGISFGTAGTVIVEQKRVPTLEGKVNQIADTSKSIFNMLMLENGSITQNGEYVDNSTRIRTINFLTGTFTVSCPDGYQIFRAMYFDSIGYLDSYAEVGKQTATITVASGLRCKLVFKANDNGNFTVNDVKGFFVLEDFESRIARLEHAPMIKFTYDHDLYANVSTIVEDKSYERTSESMANIYSYFDALVDNDYVTRVDLASELGISYPVYANGVASGDATYDETPAYKTYMYKFICSNNKVNSALMTKKKVVLVGGTHGDEAAAPFNLYVFAQRLVNDYLTDENIFKLRSAFDFYIVPCLNGYGMIHTQRVNANGVDLNRNFPIHSWYLNGAGTNNYTGPTAGSEFETQLIMALVNSIKPDMLIDHHNYSYNLNTQFYTDMWNTKQLTLAYQALTDLSIVCKSNYPQYFGSGFDFVNNAGSAPSNTASVLGYMARWCYEQHIPFAATLEIGDCVTYNNGTHAGQPINYYGADTFAVGEYTLRNQILHYGQWVLDNT